MPGPLFDCYVIAPERTAQFALRFLDLFLPDREPSFAPDDPAETLGLPLSSSLEEILSFLERHPTTAYSMYWSNRLDSGPYHAIVAFNDDGSLILGLSSTTEAEEELGRRYLHELERFSGTMDGLMLLEQAAPMSRGEFEGMIRSQAPANSVG